MSATVHNAPPSWTNQSAVFFHGTTLRHAQQLKRHGVDPTPGRARTDFGRGFYMTTSRRQAESWAVLLAASAGPKAKAAIVEIACRRDALAGLDALAFVRGDYDAEEFWSFVWECRKGAVDHGRGNTNAGLYDIVYGPVAAFWSQRSPHDADQISFHTPGAIAAIHSISIFPIP
jgi:hypothetical protein